ncbi:MAG TPA: VOC family protein [Candidatus Limnocylindria bacterium]|nr:VOC family protein [Candidatus Limnocylindria bacterium]
MVLGEVCLLTGDVVRLAGFYRWLLGVGGGSDDPVHQAVLSGGTSLTVYNDGTGRTGAGQNACLAFIVDDVDAQYERLLAHGVEVADPPQARPWGMKNLCFLDPDGSRVYLAAPIRNA